MKVIKIIKSKYKLITFIIIFSFLLIFLFFPINVYLTKKICGNQSIYYQIPFNNNHEMISMIACSYPRNEKGYTTLSQLKEEHYIIPFGLSLFLIKQNNPNNVNFYYNHYFSYENAISNSNFNYIGRACFIINDFKKVIGRIQIIELLEDTGEKSTSIGCNINGKKYLADESFLYY